MKNTISWNQMKAIQDEQLKQWENVLKPEIQAALVAKVRSMNRPFVDADTQCDIDTIAFAVPRGNSIDEIVHNWALNPSTFPVQS